MKYIEELTQEEAVSLLKRWERAASSIGICGSEYYMDPERVFQRVQDRHDSLHKGMLSWAERAHKAETELKEGRS
jgi:hypothetical protein